MKPPLGEKCALGSELLQVVKIILVEVGTVDDVQSDGGQSYSVDVAIHVCLSCRVCVCESSYVYSRVFLHMSIIHEHSKPCHLDLLTHKVQACCVLYGSFFMGKMLRQYNVFDFYHKKVHKFAPL